MNRIIAILAALMGVALCVGLTYLAATTWANGGNEMAAFTLYLGGAVSLVGGLAALDTRN